MYHLALTFAPTVLREHAANWASESLSKGTGDGEAKGAAPGAPQAPPQENQHHPNVSCDGLARILPRTGGFHIILSGKEILIKQNNPGKGEDDNKNSCLLTSIMFFNPGKR